MISYPRLIAALAVAVFVSAGTAAPALAATLGIESWRSDDRDIWSNIIIPAFNKRHPEIAVRFSPSPPREYDAGLNARLAGGTAGDLITCRPFDAALKLFKAGHLVALDDLAGMARFSDVAKAAWRTDDGKVTYCLPLASVIHGFIYNREIFDELKLTAPKNLSEFFAVLEAVRTDGRYTPLAMGTADQWEAATMGFQNIGPNYWNGEEGRKRLISGTAKLTDPDYVAVLQQLARWRPYLGRGFRAQSYADSQTLFTLGRAAIYPAGSWEIANFHKLADFPFDAFPPPPPDGAADCYISDHTDIGIGINAASRNRKQARVFLEWMTTREFATLFANALPGFFPLSDHRLTLKDPIAQRFLSWRQACKSTIRNSYQILSRGTPNLENALWNVSSQVINGTLTPKQGADKLEQGLKSWYPPHQR